MLSTRLVWIILLATFATGWSPKCISGFVWSLVAMHWLAAAGRAAVLCRCVSFAGFYKRLSDAISATGCYLNGSLSDVILRAHTLAKWGGGSDFMVPSRAIGQTGFFGHGPWRNLISTTHLNLFFFFYIINPKGVITKYAESRTNIRYSRGWL